MNCPSCGQTVGTMARFCVHCGVKLPLSCPRCGRPAETGQNFCGQCGHRLAPEGPKTMEDGPDDGERKLITVLFADVVGYTAMSERLDPEDVAHIMAGAFEIMTEEVRRYGGTVHNYLGDAIFAVFGAPAAIELHAVKACLAALSIQRAMESYSPLVERDFGLDFRLRMGVNSGMAMVGHLGPSGPAQPSAVGDTVNLAERMQSLARPGRIVISGRTEAMVRRYFQLEPLGRRQIKGKSEPVEIFQLEGRGEVTRRIEAAAARGLTPFVGRRAELDRLAATLDDAALGRGRIVGVRGQAGVGKSRLIWEFVDIASSRARVVFGHCLDYGRSESWLPVSQAVKEAFGLKAGDSVDTIRRTIVDGVENRHPELADKTPFLMDVLGLQNGSDDSPGLTGVAKKVACFDVLRELILAESRLDPLVVVLDDAHWMDPLSREFVEHLAVNIGSARVLIILLFRPEFEPAFADLDHYTPIDLEPFEPAATARLVRALKPDREIGSGLVAWVHERSYGNPLFVEELIRTLDERGVAFERDGRLELGDEASLVPASVQEIISARVDRLDHEVKLALCTAAVVGLEFDGPLLGAIMGTGPELSGWLDELVGSGFIVPRPGRGVYRFQHALTQAVAYSSLLTTRRRRIHVEVARRLERLYPERAFEFSERLAFHYSRADDVPGALKWSLASAKKARQKMNNHSALGFVERAVEIVTADPGLLSPIERYLLWWDHLRILFDLDRLDECLEATLAAARWAEAAGRESWQQSFIAFSAWVYLFLGQAATGCDIARRVRDYAGAQGRYGLAASAKFYEYLCRLYGGVDLGGFNADIDADIDFLSGLDPEAESIPGRTVGGQLSGIHLCRFMARFYQGRAGREAADYVAAYVKSTEEGLLVTGVAMASFLNIQILATFGRWGQAIELSRRMEEQGRTWGSPVSLVLGLTSRSGIYTSLGLAGEGIDLARKALDVAEEEGVLNIIKTFGRVDLLRGMVSAAQEGDGGRAVLPQILDLLETVATDEGYQTYRHRHLVILHLLAARAAIGIGDFDLAEDGIDAVMDLTDTGWYPEHRLEARWLLAVMAYKRGAGDEELAEELTNLVARAADLGYPWWEWNGCHRLAILRGRIGDGTGSAQMHARAVELLFEAARELEPVGLAGDFLGAAAQRRILDAAPKEVVSSFDSTLAVEECKLGPRKEAIMADLPNTITEVMTGMPGAFKPDAAEGLDCVMQFNFSGDEPGQWYVVIKDKTCTTSEGTADGPSATIDSPSEVWLKIARKELDGAAAFMSGQFKASGDLGLLMRMGSLFE